MTNHDEHVVDTLTIKEFKETWADREDFEFAEVTIELRVDSSISQINYLIDVTVVEQSCMVVEELVDELLAEMKSRLVAKHEPHLTMDDFTDEMMSVTLLAENPYE